MEGNLESFPGTKSLVSCLSRPGLVLFPFSLDLSPSCSKMIFFVLQIHLFDLIMLSGVDNLWMHCGI